MLYGCDVVQFVQAILPVIRWILGLRFNPGGSRHDRFERHRRVERDQLAVIHNGDAIAQAVGFVHVMRGDQNGEFPLALDVAEHFPYGDTRNWIESSSGLIEKEYFGMMHQPPRNLQTPSLTLKETSSTAVKSPYFLTMCSTWMA